MGIGLGFPGARTRPSSPLRSENGHTIFSPASARIRAYPPVAKATVSGTSPATSSAEGPPPTRGNTASHTASRAPRTLHRHHVHVLPAVQVTRSPTGAACRALGSASKAVGRPRAQVTPNEVLALRAQGLSYRAAARQLRISPALAHRLVREASAAGPPERSQTPPARFEADPNPKLHPRRPSRVIAPRPRARGATHEACNL